MEVGKYRLSSTPIQWIIAMAGWDSLIPPSHGALGARNPQKTGQKGPKSWQWKKPKIGLLVQESDMYSVHIVRRNQMGPWVTKVRGSKGDLDLPYRWRPRLIGMRNQMGPSALKDKGQKTSKKAMGGRISLASFSWFFHVFSWKNAFALTRARWFNAIDDRLSWFFHVFSWKNAFCLLS